MRASAIGQLAPDASPSAALSGALFALVSQRIHTHFPVDFL
jgi:hypothetical protein